MDLEFASKEVKNDKVVVLEAVKRNGTALRYCNVRFKNDKEVVLEAVKQDVFALEFASDELKNDKEFVLEAVKGDTDMLLDMSAKNSRTTKKSFLKLESLQNDKEFVLEVVKRNGNALQYASESLQNDKEVVFEALKESEYAIDYVGNELLKNDKELLLLRVKKSRNEKNPYDLGNVKGGEVMKDKEFVLELFDQRGSAEHVLRYASEELKKDKKVVLEAVKRNGSSLKHASEELKKDKEFVLEALKQSQTGYFALQFACEELKKDKEFVIELMKCFRVSSVLEYANKELENDKEVVLEAVKRSGTALQYVSDEFKSDKEIVLEAVKQDGLALQCLGEEFKKDKEVVLEAVKNAGYALEYASDELKNDKEVVLEAVKNVGQALQYVSEEFQDDKEIVLEAIKQDGNSLSYVSFYLQDDREVVLEAVKRDGNVLQYASEELQNDKEVVLEAVKQNGCAFQFASFYLLNDKEVALEVVKQYGEQLQYASEELQNDKEVVLEAVKNDGAALQYAGEGLQNDKEVVLEAVKNAGYVFEFASEELQNDKEVVLEAVKQNGSALEYASFFLQNDKEVVLEALQQDEDVFEFASLELVEKAEKSGVTLLEWLMNERERSLEKELKIEKFETVEMELKQKEEQWEEERKAIADENQQMLDSVLDSVGKRFRIEQQSLKIHRDGKLGKGGFGSVFCADWTNDLGENREVAVKIVSYGIQADGLDVFKEFSRSLQFRDDNVIRTFGFDDSRRNEIAIVMEKLDGNLHDYVRENVLTLEEKWGIMVKMTKGVHYLHSMTPKPFLHRDIKGENFLFKLDEEGELSDVKVCDFGLAKAVTDSSKQTQVSVAGQGTKLWMAPEAGRGLYSVKSDVYSLGITFWEILFEEYPYEGLDPNHVFYKVGVEGLRPALNIYHEKKTNDDEEEEEDEGEEEASLKDGILPKFLKELLESCWKADRKSRPSTQDLLLWFDDNEMEMLAEYDEGYFPPLGIQKKMKEGTHRTKTRIASSVKERKDKDMSSHGDDVEADDKSIKDDSREVLSKSDTVERGLFEEMQNKLQKEIMSLRMENESLREFLEKNQMLEKYLEAKASARSGKRPSRPSLGRRNKKPPPVPKKNY